MTYDICHIICGKCLKHFRHNISITMKILKQLPNLYSISDFEL